MIDIMREHNVNMSYDAQVCEYNKLRAEIARLQEAAQYFTCRGYLEIDSKISEAIDLAERVRKAKRFWIEDEFSILEQEAHVEAITYDAENER